MNAPQHHLADELLHSYALGSLDPAGDLFVACHLTLCPTCRASVREHEAVAGALLASGSSSPAPPEQIDASLEAVLARLDEPAAEASHPVYDPVLPAPLASIVGSFDSLAWRPLIPGAVRQIALPVGRGDVPLRLLRLAPGFKVPPHTHDGGEHTLVLTGGFKDDVGSFQRGDVATREPSPEHHQIIDRDGPCIALVLADGLIVPTTLLGKVMSWVITA